MSKRKIKMWILLMKCGGLCGCHQMYERSFSFRGYQLPVCARCTGNFIGYIIAAFLYAMKVRISLKICALFILIMATDGFLQLFKIKESNNLRRVITGTLAGIGYVFGLIYIILYFS